MPGERLGHQPNEQSSARLQTAAERLRQLDSSSAQNAETAADAKQRFAELEACLRGLLAQPRDPVAQGFAERMINASIEGMAAEILAILGHPADSAGNRAAGEAVPDADAGHGSIDPRERRPLQRSAADVRRPVSPLHGPAQPAERGSGEPPAERPSSSEPSATERLHRLDPVTSHRPALVIEAQEHLVSLGARLQHLAATYEGDPLRQRIAERLGNVHGELLAGELLSLIESGQPVEEGFIEQRVEAVYAEQFEKRAPLFTPIVRGNGRSRRPLPQLPNYFLVGERAR